MGGTQSFDDDPEFIGILLRPVDGNPITQIFYAIRKILTQRYLFLTGAFQVFEYIF